MTAKLPLSTSAQVTAMNCKAQPRRKFAVLAKQPIDQSNVGSVCWTPDGSHLVLSANHGRYVQVRRASDLSLVRQFEKAPDGFGPNESMALSSDGTLLISTPSSKRHGDALLGIWDLGRGSLVHEVDQQFKDGDRTRRFARPKNIRLASGTGDIVMIATEFVDQGNPENVIVIIDRNWKISRAFRPHARDLHSWPLVVNDSIVFGRLVSGPDHLAKFAITTVFSYDLSKQSSAVVDERYFLFEAMAAHPSDQVVALGKGSALLSLPDSIGQNAVGEFLDTIVVRDLAARRDLIRIRCPIEPIRDLLWTSNGQYLVVQSGPTRQRDGIVYSCWDARTGEWQAAHNTPSSASWSKMALHPKDVRIAYCDDSGLTVLELQ
jgi:hypothetical protein